MPDLLDKPPKADDFLGEPIRADDFLGPDPSVPRLLVSDQPSARLPLIPGQPKYEDERIFHPPGVEVGPDLSRTLDENKAYQDELDQKAAAERAIDEENSFGRFISTPITHHWGTTAPKLIEKIPGVPFLKGFVENKVPGGKALSGAAEGAQEIGDSFASPLGIATLGMGALPKLAQRIISMAFAVDMARHLPEEAVQLKQAIDSGDQKEAAKAATGLVGNSVFSALAAKHGLTFEGPGAPPPGSPGEPAPPKATIPESMLPAAEAEAAKATAPTATTGATDASKISKAAEVHGDVQPLKPPAGVVPVEEGGKGVQPQAAGGIPKAGETPPAGAPSAPVRAAEAVKPNDESTGLETNESIASRTEAGPERSKAFSERAAAQKRLALTLKPGDVLVDSDGVRRVVTGVSPKDGAVFMHLEGATNKTGLPFGLEPGMKLERASEAVSPLEQKLANPDTFQGKDWTKDSYNYGTDATPEQLAELTKLEQQYADQMKAIPKTVENLGKIAEIGKRKQWATEALRFRRALEEAKSAGAKTDAELAAIARKHGVGAGRGGDDAAYAKDLKEGLAKEVTPAVPPEAPAPAAPAAKIPPFKADKTKLPSPITDYIKEKLGLIRNKKYAKPGTEGYYGSAYQDAIQRHGTGLFGEKGRTPDEIVHDLREAGMMGQNASVDDLWDMIIGEHKAQVKHRQGLSPEAQGDKFYEAVDKNLKKKNVKVVSVGEMGIGAKFKLNGQEFEITHIDPDTGEVTAKDGRKFGSQTIPDGADIPVDKGSYEPAKEGEFEPEPPKKEGDDLGPGMGAAKPVEFEPGGGTATGSKNATVDRERAERGLPPAIEPLRRSFGTVWDEAMSIIDRAPETQDNLIDELRKKPRALTDLEDAMLLHRQVGLRNEFDKATRDLAQAYEDGNDAMVVQNKLRVAEMSDKLQDIYDIGKRSGTETGRGLNARKMMANEDYSLAKMDLDKRAANGGKPLTEEQRAEITRLNGKIEATQKAYDEYVAKTDKRLAEVEAQAAIDRLKAQTPAVDPVVKRIVDRIGTALHTQRDAARARIRERMGRVSSGIDPTALADYAIVGASHLFDGVLEFGKWSEKMIGEFSESIKPHLQQIFAASNEHFDKSIDAAAGKQAPKVRKQVKDLTAAERIDRATEQVREKVKAGKKDEVTAVVQRLARMFVEKGITERDPLIDAIHGILQGIDPSFTRRQTMDAISGYGDFKPLSKDQISVKLRDLKGQMQQVAKLEDMQAGTPPSKTGVQRRVPTAEESRLIKLVNQAKREFQIPVTDPETQLKSSLDELKKRLANRTAELQAKLAAGDFAPKPRRELKLDAEAQRLKAANERAKEEFRRGLVADRLKNRTPWEKAMDTLVKWRRAFLLSSPVTLAKLTSAAVQRMTFTPAEEVIGLGLSKAFPGIARVASREGGLSVKGEAKALVDGFTLGMKDAWQVLKTGKSDLDVLYGKDKGYPNELINFMGNLHGALKTVTKRNEFARSLQKRAESAMAAGIDVSDPMVQTRLAVEAYKDANRSIFMQDNAVVAGYKRALSALDQPDKATGKVPLARKAAGTVARVLLPIVKIPTNIVAETFEYALGSVTGTARLGRALARGTENLKPEEAELILRNLKKGSLGAAVMLLGFFNPSVVGGYYQEGEHRKKSDVKPGNVRVYGHDVPSYLLHNPLLETLQLGATVRRVADSKLRKRDTENQGIGAGIVAGGLGLSEEVPFVREMFEVSKAFNPHERGAFFGELGRSVAVPQAVQWVAQHTDKDAEGNMIARKPGTAMERIKVGVPGLREQVKKNPVQPRP